MSTSLHVEIDGLCGINSRAGDACHNFQSADVITTHHCDGLHATERANKTVDRYVSKKSNKSQRFFLPVTLHAI